MTDVSETRLANLVLGKEPYNEARTRAKNQSKTILPGRLQTSRLGQHVNTLDFPWPVPCKRPHLMLIIVPATSQSTSRGRSNDANLDFLDCLEIERI